jgi:hypothetical protein
VNATFRVASPNGRTAGASIASEFPHARTPPAGSGADRSPHRSEERTANSRAGSVDWSTGVVPAAGHEAGDPLAPAGFRPHPEGDPVRWRRDNVSLAPRRDRVVDYRRLPEPIGLGRNEPAVKRSGAAEPPAQGRARKVPAAGLAVALTPPATGRAGTEKWGVSYREIVCSQGRQHEKLGVLPPRFGGWERYLRTSSEVPALAAHRPTPQRQVAALSRTAARRPGSLQGAPDDIGPSCKTGGG